MLFKLHTYIQQQQHHKHCKKQLKNSNLQGNQMKNSYRRHQQPGRQLEITGIRKDKVVNCKHTSCCCCSSCGSGSGSSGCCSICCSRTDAVNTESSSLAEATVFLKYMIVNEDKTGGRRWRGQWQRRTSHRKWRGWRRWRSPRQLLTKQGECKLLRSLYEGG